MAGTQKPEEKKEDKQYEHVFGPVFIEKTTIERIKSGLPELPDLDKMSQLGIPCDLLLAALNYCSTQLQTIMRLPKHLSELAKFIIEQPFQVAQEVIDKALEVFDNLNAAINAMFSGAAGAIDNLKLGLRKLLDCPFLADTELGKLAAKILDMINSGMMITSLIFQFKSYLRMMASSVIDFVKNIPISAINDLQRLLDDILARSPITDAIKFLEYFARCAEALCISGEALWLAGKEAYELAKSAYEWCLEKGPNGFIDTATGMVKGIVVKPVTEAGKQAMKIADSIDLIRFGEPSAEV